MVGLVRTSQLLPITEAQSVGRPVYWFDMRNELVAINFINEFVNVPATSNIVNFAPDPVLDVMVHAINSVVMVVELVCSAHPSRLLHIMQPLYFAAAYMIFTVVYYFAGGTDP